MNVYRNCTGFFFSGIRTRIRKDMYSDICAIFLRKRRIYQLICEKNPVYYFKHFLFLQKLFRCFSMKPFLDYFVTSFILLPLKILPEILLEIPPKFSLRIHFRNSSGDSFRNFIKNSSRTTSTNFHRNSSMNCFMNLSGHSFEKWNHGSFGNAIS